MPDALRLLTDLGAWSVWGLWAPLAAWSALVLVAEGLMQRARPHVALRYPLRRGLVWGLPLAVALPPLLAALWPEAPVTPWPEALVLPTLSVPLLAEAPTPRALPWPRLLGGSGVVALALLGLVETARVVWTLRGLRGRGAQASPEHAALLRRLRKDEGVPRAVRLAACPRAAVPYTSGWRRPLIVFPEALLMDPGGLRLALRHELAHVMQRDFAHALAERLALAPLAAWFPPARLLLRGLALDRECLCDAEVLTREPRSRGAYARLLLAFAERPAPAPLLTVPFFTTHLVHRLDAMARPLSPPRHARFAGSALASLVLAGVLLFSLAAAAPSAASPALLSPPLPAPASPASTASAEALLREDVRTSTFPSLTDTVTGRITDADTQAPIVGALVVAAGAPQAPSTTDQDGRYTLPAPSEGTIILVAAPGYSSRQIRLAASQRELNVALTKRNDELTREQMEQLVRAQVEAARARTGANDSAELTREQMEQLVRAQVEAARARTGAAEGGREQSTAPRPEVFEVVEQDPILIGGIEGLQQRVRYPEAARAAGIQGTVFVQFIVNEQGVPTEIQIVRSPDAALNEAALQAVREARFEPGVQRGRPVKVRFTLPVRFALPTE